MEKFKFGDLVTSIYGWIGVAISYSGDQVECNPCLDDCGRILSRGYVTDPRTSTQKEIDKFNKAAIKHGYIYKNRLFKINDEI